MAAIGAIRKHGVLLMVIIGIALLAFLLGDFTNFTGMLSNKNTMVSVNGKKMNDEYQILYEQNSALWKIMYDKSSLEESETYQVHDMTWNQLIEDKIIDDELKKLGLSFTEEMIEAANAELLASLRSQQPNQFLYKLFVSIAEISSEEAALSFINNIDEYKNNPQLQDFYNTYKAIEHMNLSNMKRRNYFSLAQSSDYYSTSLIQKIAKDNRSAMVTFASIDPNGQVFGNIVPTVTPKEMKEWYKKNKNRYKVIEDVCHIDVAVFPIVPSNADLIAIEDSVKNAFQLYMDAPSLESYRIESLLSPLDSNYVKKEDILLEPLDSLIFNQPVGSYIEPYNYESKIWYFGKVYGMAMRPDSIEVAYLVVDYKTERNPSSPRTKVEAKTEADSLKNILQSQPALIYSLLSDYLAGRNASDSTLWMAEKATYREMYDSLLTAYNHKEAYVEYNSGAYIVFLPTQITDLKEKRLFDLHSVEIKASESTTSELKNSAIQLASESTSPDHFLQNANKKGIQIVRGSNVTSMTADIQDLRNCRDIVSWAFNDDTKKGEISSVYKLDQGIFAVAILRDSRKKGFAKFENAQNEIEAELLAKKKMEMVQETIEQELKNNNSIEYLATKFSVTLRDSVTLHYAHDLYQNAQIENGAIGKLFTLKPDQQTNLITGKYYLYLVQVNNMENTQPSEGFFFERSLVKNMVTGKTRNEITILTDLKEKADILDNRRYFYRK